MRFEQAITGFLLIFGFYPLLALDPAYENAPINYSSTKAITPLTVIRDRIAKGEDLLSGTSDQEVLRKLLALLKIPIESQVLVYSKTSAQNSLISPQRPRAIYFSDNAYVGWVQNGDIEVITFDAKLGMAFHLVKISRRKNQKVEFIRDQSCLNCHGGSATRNWPGLLVRSVYPKESGQPIFHAGTFRTDHASPLSERWGGWYVTGDASGQSHLGNIIAEESESTDRRMKYKPIITGSVKSLDEVFSTKPYLGGGVSDIVALMILEHQLIVHNSLVEGSLVTQQTLARHKQMKKVFGEPIDSELSETNQSILDSQAERILKALLFVGEHKMIDTGIEGSPAFQSAFEASARKNTEGRALRHLRLYERLFKYRCSYLIYSDAFSNLPKLLKIRILKRLNKILLGQDSDPDFNHLSKSERLRILSILKETLPEFNQTISR